MRRFGMIVIVLLLMAVLTLMMASAGLLPFSFSIAVPRSQPLSVTGFLTSTEHKKTEQLAEIRPQLLASTPHGRITVQGADVEQVQIETYMEAKASTPLKAQDLLGRITLELTTTEEANTLTVLMPKLQPNEMLKADLTILVPTQTALDLKTGLGQIEVTNIQGNLCVFDQLGTIKVQGFHGDANLETALGNIEISHSRFDKELVALTHLGDLSIDASLAERNILESNLGDLRLLLSPEESYVLEGSISLGRFTSLVSFKGQHSEKTITGIIGEGEQRGAIFVDLSLGSLELKNSKDRGD